MTKKSGEERPAFLIYFNNIHWKRSVTIAIILLLWIISNESSKSQSTSSHNLNTLLYFNEQGATTTDENYISHSFTQTGKLILETFINNIHIKVFNARSLKS